MWVCTKRIFYKISKTYLQVARAFVHNEFMRDIFYSGWNETEAFKTNKTKSVIRLNNEVICSSLFYNTCIHASQLREVYSSAILKVNILSSLVKSCKLKKKSIAGNKYPHYFQCANRDVSEFPYFSVTCYTCIRACMNYNILFRSP